MAYRGTNYHGFQIQNNAITVQEVLQKSVSVVLNEEISITGCSRTDTGVHANQFCFNVHTNSQIGTRGFVRGVNGLLPDDISILSCEEVTEDFHARFDCKGKEYIYRIHCSESKNPFASDLMFHYRRKLNLEAMKNASFYFVGTHDFASFCADRSNVSTTIRTVYSLRIESYDNEVIIYIKGDGFLYNMVRIIVGTLIDVSEGRILPDDIPEIINAKNRLRAGRTAMAHGLYLNRVFYNENELLV